MIHNEAPDYGHRYNPAEYDVTFERIGGMVSREVLLPELLQEAGCATAIYGKWDLGSLQRFLPTSRGFDDFYSFVNTGIDYYTHERYGVPSMYRNESPTEEDEGEYWTTLFEREALRFLSERDLALPFFLYLHLNAPHSSSTLDSSIRSTIQAPAKFKAMYPPVETETKSPSKPHQYAGETAKITTPEARQRDFRASVTSMDTSIEIFLSDNGGGYGSDDAPLRGKEGNLWEGGLSVPCLVRWPDGDVPADIVNSRFVTSKNHVLATAGPHRHPLEPLEMGRRGRRQPGPIRSPFRPGRVQ